MYLEFETHRISNPFCQVSLSFRTCSPTLMKMLLVEYIGKKIKKFTWPSRRVVSQAQF